MKRVIVLIVLSCLAGCGYTFQGSGSVLPPDVKNIYVPRVENNSAEQGMATTMTEALRDRFERFGVVTIVESINEADAVLNAKILKIKRGTRTTTSNTDTALQQETTLSVAAELRRVTGPILWKDGEISVSRSFGTDSQVVVTSSADFSESALSGSDLSGLNTREIARGQEQEALAALADDVATKIYDGAVAPEF